MTEFFAFLFSVCFVVGVFALSCTPERGAAAPTDKYDVRNCQDSDWWRTYNAAIAGSSAMLVDVEQAHEKAVLTADLATGRCR